MLFLCPTRIYIIVANLKKISVTCKIFVDFLFVSGLNEPATSEKPQTKG